MLADDSGKIPAEVTNPLLARCPGSGKGLAAISPFLTFCYHPS
jgi:hypothetical protein